MELFMWLMMYWSCIYRDIVNWGVKCIVVGWVMVKNSVCINIIEKLLFWCVYIRNVNIIVFVIVKILIKFKKCMFLMFKNYFLVYVNKVL